VHFHGDDAKQRYDGLVAVAAEVVVGLDFDGTLAPIVEDPESATIHPEAPTMLSELAQQVRAVVIITGRPARQVVRLGDLEGIADGLPAEADLAVMGQYGNETWDSSSRSFTSPEPPAGLQAFREELPGLLAAEHAEEAHVEEKGLAIAVHTRRLPDAQATFARLKERLGEAAERHDLHLEPGRMVLEVRTPGMHKGLAVRTALKDHDGGGVLFVGDDLGDVEAFEAVRSMAQDGLPTLLVCSSSNEQDALHELADVVVAGPDGVMDFLEAFAADAVRRTAGAS
jgi:trehalose 6-phosphate phosphatase